MFLVSAALMLGFMFGTTSARLKYAAPTLGVRKSAAAARLGIRRAEDWLMTSARSNDFPSCRNYLETDPYKRIEAVHSGGGAPVSAGETLPYALYIADADYAPGFLVPLTRRSDAHGIPRIPAADTGEAIVRYYYLRSVSSPDNSPAIAAEELLAVSRDKTSGAVSAERLFYRTGSVSAK
jgi:hypothetical protein